MRNLEVPLLYDMFSEDLWELDEEAFTTFQYFTGANTLEEIATKLKIDKSEIQQVIKELGPEIIINEHDKDAPSKLELARAPIPSLRTILIHITRACNLTCRHCYLDKEQKQSIDLERFLSAVSQFEKLQGMKVIISGGEPLLHPKFFEMLEAIKNIKLRKMLLSNGMLIDEKVAQQLKPLVHEVQISVDGTNSHNKFRNNPYAFQKAIQAIKNLIEVGMDVSVATMVHSQNLNELPELEKLLKELQIKSWALDVPSQTGEFKNHPELYPSLEEAGKALKRYGWGAPFEDQHNIYACGAHLCAIMPNGDVCKCGFFESSPVGNLMNMSLAECWRILQKKFIWRQSDLECAAIHCPHLQDCRGGCRFRAYVNSGHLMGLDHVKCMAFGFKYPKE
ncbi:MAG: radical SAM protein [Candidatus Helarchaeota archaeon]